MSERGPLMLGIEGVALTSRDRARLADPRVGGVILFARNFESSRQLRALTASIRELRSELLIAVDHEGGRVQRLIGRGFTRLPPMRTLGERWESDPGAAGREALRHGQTIARELTAHGIDFSFTPVLDLDWGRSGVIGDRAFHSDPVVVAQLAGQLVRGLASGGMAAVAKHYPGHGHVDADSHHSLPIDPRPLAKILASDLVPFGVLIAQGIQAIMPAHVVYPAVDAEPAGYSKVWIGDVLRRRLAFDGLVISDDLCMAGAGGAGDIVARADAAIAAGCDVALVCNGFDAIDDLLARWQPPAQPDLVRRYQRVSSR